MNWKIDLKNDIFVSKLKLLKQLNNKYDILNN